MNPSTVRPAKERVKFRPQRHSREGGNLFQPMEQDLRWVPSPAGPVLRRVKCALLLALALLAPAPAHAWSLWNEMVEQISIKPQEKPMPFPQRSVPVPGTATMRVQDQESATAIANPIQPTPESIKTGKQLFAIYCTPCHGASGTGNGLVGEKLSVRPFDLTSDAVQGLPDGFVFGYLTFRGTVMPSYANDLSPTERWHVINYLHHGLKPAAPQQAANQPNDQAK